MAHYNSENIDITRSQKKAKGSILPKWFIVSQRHREDRVAEPRYIDGKNFLVSTTGTDKKGHR
jgi:hypothetical protein